MDFTWKLSVTANELRRHRLQDSRTRQFSGKFHVRRVVLEASEWLARKATGKSLNGSFVPRWWKSGPDYIHTPPASLPPRHFPVPAWPHKGHWGGSTFIYKTLTFIYISTISSASSQSTPASPNRTTLYRLFHWQSMKIFSKSRRRETGEMESLGHCVKARNIILSIISSDKLTITGKTAVFHGKWENYPSIFHN